jgi:hypothetical protein
MHLAQLITYEGNCSQSLCAVKETLSLDRCFVDGCAIAMKKKEKKLASIRKKVVSLQKVNKLRIEK